VYLRLRFERSLISHELRSVFEEDTLKVAA